ncbi:MAG: hypothetical protein Q4A71_07160 [Actinomycetaceae bacterium]|nr:hypothetical protein [Actinomycetaceae bacterium]
MFTIEADLPRPLYPIAWLVGQWRGFEVAGANTFVQEIGFVPEGDLLRQTTTRYLARRTRNFPITATAAEALAGLEVVEKTSVENSVWQVVRFTDADGGAKSDLAVTEVEEGGARGKSQGAVMDIGADATSGGVSEEASGALREKSQAVPGAEPQRKPAGIWLGQGQGPRIQLKRDQRERFYGMVGGELMWLEECGGKAVRSARLAK